MYFALDTIWTLVAAALVFFMQAGFAMVETGFTRAKNAGNIIMKNLMDFALGTIGFWVLGFGLMFGGTGALVGGIDFLIQGDYSTTIPTAAFVIFQTVFCATAATIVSGAMAERTKFSSYCVYSVVISTLIYPISGHWIWGGGWLSQLGFHDFAGSTAVHMVGGISALLGAIAVGPRTGKFDKKGRAIAIPGHNLTVGALGVFILWFCWFGFNGGSTVSMTGDAAISSASHIFVTTNLAAAAAATVVMCITWVRYKKPDISMTLNGALAGLVGVTAGCDLVSPVGAFCIGIIAGFAVVFGIELLEKRFHVDDPVGAVGVHGICGGLGTILTGVFAKEGGLLYGGGFQMLGVQLLGVGAVALWVVITVGTLFQIVKHTMGLRVSAAEEALGLDVEEHGLASSYADFMPAASAVPVVYTNITAAAEAVAPAAVIPQDKEALPMTKVVVITKESRLETLKTALDTLGVTGMTVTHVLGHGMQTKATRLYRGAPIETTLMPRVKVEIVICKIPLTLLLSTVQKALHTGVPGDGKIFVSTVDKVVKISTEEQNYDALQDE